MLQNGWMSKRPGVQKLLYLPATHIYTHTYMPHTHVHHQTFLASTFSHLEGSSFILNLTISFRWITLKQHPSLQN